jgi:hypothetical protein
MTHSEFEAKNDFMVAEGESEGRQLMIKYSIDMEDYKRLTPEQLDNLNAGMQIIDRVRKNIERNKC